MPKLGITSRISSAMVSGPDLVLRHDSIVVVSEALLMQLLDLGAQWTSRGSLAIEISTAARRTA